MLHTSRSTNMQESTKYVYDTYCIGHMHPHPCMGIPGFPCNDLLDTLVDHQPQWRNRLARRTYKQYSPMRMRGTGSWAMRRLWVRSSPGAGIFRHITWPYEPAQAHRMLRVHGLGETHTWAAWHTWGYGWHLVTLLHSVSVIVGVKNGKNFDSESNGWWICKDTCPEIVL